MTTILLGLAVIAAQTKTVTITSSVAGSSIVLAELGEAANVRMRPSGSVNQDFLFVRFKDTPLKVAMERIAQTLNATWVKDGTDSYLLTRTHNQELEDEKPSPGLRALMSKFLEDVAIKEMSSEEYAKFCKANENGGGFWSFSGGPPERMVNRFVTLLGADQICNIPEGESRWYFLNPTLPGTQLPGSWKQALAVFGNELEVETNLSRNELEQPEEGPHQPISMPTCSICLRREGQQLDTSIEYSSPGIGGTSSGNLQSEDAQQIKTLLTSLDDHLTFSKDFEAAFEGIAQQRESAKDSRKPWKQVLLGKDDFLTVATEDFFKSTAKSLDKDLVAFVPDSLGSQLLWHADEISKKRLGDLWKEALGEEGSVYLGETEDYVSIRPLDPAVARQRIDRRALNKLASDIDANSWNVDNQAEFAATTELDSEMSTATGVLNSLALPLKAEWSRNDYDLLRIYGRLSADLRLIVKGKGLFLKLAELPQNLTPSVMRLLSGSNTNLQVFDEFSENMPDNYRENCRTPAFIFNAGFPSGSFVGIKLSNRENLAVKLKEGYVSSSPLDPPTDSGYDRSGSFDRFGSNVSYLFGDFENITGYAVVSNSRLEADFGFTGVGKIEDAFETPVITPNTKFLPKAQLSDEWRRKLEGAMSGIRYGRYEPPPSRS